MDLAERTDRVRCPKCGSKTRTLVREQTILEDFLLFCPKCRYECVIAFKNGKIEKLLMPDAKTLS